MLGSIQVFQSVDQKFLLFREKELKEMIFFLEYWDSALIAVAVYFHNYKLILILNLIFILVFRYRHILRDKRDYKTLFILFLFYIFLSYRHLSNMPKFILKLSDSFKNLNLLKFLIIAECNEAPIVSGTNKSIDQSFLASNTLRNNLERLLTYFLFTNNLICLKTVHKYLVAQHV